MQANGGGASSPDYMASTHQQTARANAIGVPENAATIEFEHRIKQLH
jgi:hypothetical protein